MSERNVKKDTLVIFDLVSTLTDAAPRYVRAFQDGCIEKGITPPDADTVQVMLGNKNLSEITDLVVGPMEPSLKAEFMNACNKKLDALLYRPDWHEALYPNVRETSEDLRKSGINLGVFTGTREDMMESQLYYHDIIHLFDERYMRGKDNDRDYGKTNEFLKTEQLRSIIDTFKTDHPDSETTIIVIGDTSSDAEAAANLGVLFIGFAENDKKFSRLEKVGVTNIVRNFSDLPEMIAKCSAKTDKKTTAPRRSRSNPPPAAR